MRIIGEISHPTLKISIFKNEGRLSVKFENPLFEQTFKLGNDERFASPEDARKLVDGAFIENVLSNFQAMNQARAAALSRNFPSPENESFEEII